MNDFWNHRDGENQPWMRSADLKGLFTKTKLLLVVASLVGIASGAAYINLAMSHSRTVLIAGDGRAYAGVPEGFRLTSEAFERLCKDVISAVLLRTEQGDVDALVNGARLQSLKRQHPDRELHELPAGRRSQILAAFVHPGVLAKMDETFGTRKESKDRYSQYFTIAELRVENATPEQVEVQVRGVLSSSSISNYQSSEVFLAAIFRPVKQTNENPLGWMLYGAAKMTRDQFYEKERTEAVRRATKTAESNPKP